MDQTFPQDNGARNLAVVGARGVLGRAFLDELAAHASPVATVFALGSADGVGESVPFGRHELPLYDAATFDFSQVGWVVIAALSPSVSVIAQRALEAGCFILDFSTQKSLPRYWPSCLTSDMAQHMAVPDAASVILARVFQPLLESYTVVSADIVTLEAVSARGQPAVDELAGQTAALFNQQPLQQNVFEQRIAFNVLPLATEAEHRLQRELAEGFNLPLSVLSVRRTQVPVFFGHCMSVRVQFEQAVSVADVMALLEEASGIRVMPLGAAFEVTPMTVTGHDEISIAPIEAIPDTPHAIHLWIAADNARAGVARPAFEWLLAVTAQTS